jgi:hypothetical protein
MRHITLLSLILLVLLIAAAPLLCGCKVDRSARPGPDDTPEVEDFDKEGGFKDDADRSFGRETERGQPGGQEKEKLLEGEIRDDAP